jgi:nucleoside 2-deoxyribosyltransferase
VIRAEGWEHLDRHEKEAVISDQAFVAMSFSDAMKPAWEAGIELAINAAGYRPYRVDEELHVDRIDAKIEVEIRNSRFLVADVTEGKKGVYFEAGFALGLGKPVIWSVRKDALDHDVHFDTRQYRHIVWESPDELKRELTELICAVVGRRKRTRAGADS